MHFYCKKKVKKIKTEITTIHRFKDKIVNQITIQKKRVIRYLGCLGCPPLSLKRHRCSCFRTLTPHNSRDCVKKTIKYFANIRKKITIEGRNKAKTVKCSI